MLENDDVPKEMNKNHVLGGRVGSDYSYAFYNPHNARFYFNFNKWNFKPDMLRFKTINSTELCIDYLDCRIVVKKFKIEITNKINTERRFTIWLESESENKAVEKANKIIEDEVISVFKSFISEFGGSSDFSFTKHIPDNKILHDLIIDKLPKDMRFRNEVVKKEYNTEPSNVEFANPVYASNYFRNAGLRLFAPEIDSRLKAIEDERLEFSKSLALYTEQINLHLKVEERQLEVQNETLKTLKLIQDSTHSVNLSEGVKVTTISSLPQTLSKYSSVEDLKVLRLKKVRKLLSDYGWGESIW